MDRCKCWIITSITIEIEHCPSSATTIAKEIDRVIQFTMKESKLPQFGKTTVGTNVLLNEEK